MTPLLILGAGRMGGAPIHGWRKAGGLAPSDLIMPDPHPPHPSASSSSATSDNETAAMEVATTTIATPKGPAGGYRSARSQAPRALQPEGVGDPAALSATRHKARQRLARSSGAPRCTVRTAPVVGYGQYPHCSRYGGGSDAGASRPVMSHDRPH